MILKIKTEEWHNYYKKNYLKTNIIKFEVLANLWCYDNIIKKYKMPLVNF